MTPDANYGQVSKDFKTAYGKVYNGIINECTCFKFFKGHVGLPTMHRTEEPVGAPAVVQTVTMTSCGPLTAALKLYRREFCQLNAVLEV